MMVINYMLALIVSIAILVVIAAVVWAWKSYKKQLEYEELIRKRVRNHEAIMDGNRAFPEEPKKQPPSE